LTSHRKISSKYDDGRPHSVRRVKKGVYLCRWCSKECPGRRTSYCSKECSDAAGVYIYPSIRDDKILERDKGVCADCGIDTVKLRRVLKKLYARVQPPGKETQEEFEVRLRRKASYEKIVNQLSENGWRGVFGGWYSNRWNLSNRLWQADHITPKILGGHDDLENFRTLCVPCHKAASARLAKHRARLRKKQSHLWEKSWTG
jgi:5-methylcytosine-specific restriction endonuclease McrA